MAGDCYAHLGKTHTAFIPMREVLRAFFVFVTQVGHLIVLGLKVALL